MRFVATVTLAASIERVFAYLDDPELLKKWVTGLEATAIDKPGVPRAVGTQFRLSLHEAGRVQEMRGEVTEYRPPGEIAARLTGPQFMVVATYRLAAQGDSTRVEQRVDLTLVGWVARIVAPLGKWLLQRRQVQALQRLKEVVESAS